MSGLTMRRVAVTTPTHCIKRVLGGLLFSNSLAFASSLALLRPIDYMRSVKMIVISPKR